VSKHLSPHKKNKTFSKNNMIEMTILAPWVVLYILLCRITRQTKVQADIYIIPHNFSKKLKKLIIFTKISFFSNNFFWEGHGDQL